jgi:hypothetical protein
MSEKEKYKYKTGSQKRKDRERSQLSSAGCDPKQKKLSFFTDKKLRVATTDSDINVRLGQPVQSTSNELECAETSIAIENRCCIVSVQHIADNNVESRNDVNEEFPVQHTISTTSSHQLEVQLNVDAGNITTTG